MHGTDARDWVRGKRPWSQFLNYCDTIAQDEGGQLWAAQLTDPRHFDAIRQQVEQQRGKTSRPPLRGHTAEVRGLYMVANQLRMWMQAQGAQVELIDGPAGPMELMEAEHKQHTLSLVDAALGYEEVS